jgi:sulfotransferase family protein
VYEAIAADEIGQRWMKVHDAYTRTAEGEPLLGRYTACAAIYLVRDPRDVAVSFSHHSGTSIDDAIKLMNAADGALADSRKGLATQLRQKLLGWSGHVTSWLDQTDVPVHLLRYEDLKASPVERFGAALHFAGRAATHEEIRRAVRHTDFAELRRQEMQKGFAERGSKCALFFREGRSGGWRVRLSVGQVKEIEQCHGSVMSRLGYALESDLSSTSGCPKHAS